MEPVGFELRQLQGDAQVIDLIFSGLGSMTSW